MASSQKALIPFYPVMNFCHYEMQKCNVNEIWSFGTRYKMIHVRISSYNGERIRVQILLYKQLHILA